MKKQYLLLFLITLIPVLVFSQDTSDTSWQYFGQKPPGLKPKVFAPELIEHLAHSSPTFSPDGTEIYWSTVSGKNETRKIYFVKYADGKWSEKKLVSFSGHFHDDQPFISYDGQKMFFASKRTEKEDGSLGLDIWIANKICNSWGEPKTIDNNIGFWTPTVTRSGTIYFLDNVNGEIGIYRSEYKNGKYLVPELLPEQINKKKTQNSSPFIAPDETYLIFSSNRPGSKDEYGDLYISFRKNNGEWGEAINMGDSINTTRQERFPGVSPDGKYLFFTRWYKSPFYHDLYWIDASIIEKLKP